MTSVHADLMRRSLDALPRQGGETAHTVATTMFLAGLIVLAIGASFDQRAYTFTGLGLTVGSAIPAAISRFQSKENIFAKECYRQDFLALGVEL